MTISALFLIAVLFAADAALNVFLPVPHKHLPMMWSFICRFTEKSERQLNRVHRSNGARFMRGVLLLLFVVGLAVAVAFAVQYARWRLPSPYGWGAYLAVLAVSLYMAAPWKIMRKVAKLLEIDQRLQTEEARKVLAPFVPVNLAGLDRHALARVTIEFSVWALARGMVGTIFWFLVAGVYGLCIYVFVSGMAYVVGYQSDHFQAFSRGVRTVDAALHFIPARLAAAVIFLAAFFTPKGTPFKSLKLMLSESMSYGAMNRGWELAAMAGALGITLGGPMTFLGGGVTYGWLGNEGTTAKVEPWHIRRAIMLHAAGYLVILTILVVALGLQAGWRVNWPL